jgi:hypothetical protein
MTTFDKREEGFEKQFAHDEELRFKANARRNKYLGLWAAQKLGRSGAEADAYAKEVVIADFESAGDSDVFGKVRKDFDEKQIPISDHQLRRTMDELMAKAIEEIRTGKKAWFRVLQPGSGQRAGAKRRPMTGSAKSGSTPLGN